MIRINVFIQVESSGKAKFLELAKELVEKSLTDAGCIAYDLFESSTRPDVFMICETWQDEASLKAHSSSAHFVSLLPEIEKYAKLKIEKLQF